MMNQLIIKALIFLVGSLASGLLVTPGLYITSPESGAVVEGVVEIKGSIPEDGFSSAELLYEYSQAELENWFLIKRLDQVVRDGVLAAWDSTTITDGVYSIKLVVRAQDGTENEVIVENIQVSNYSQASIQTGAAQPANPGNAPSVVDALKANPSVTEVSSNPASVFQEDVRRTAIIGALFAFLALSILALYTTVQSRRRRR